MFSAMQISESAQGLVLSYPLSTGLVFLAAAVALSGYGLLGRRFVRRRWPVVFAGFVALWAAGYFMSFTATLDQEAGSVYVFPGPQQSIRWQDAADVYLEHRGGGSDSRIVVLDAQRRMFDLDVANLSLDDRQRVMEYMVDRIPPGASGRTPALLERQAPAGARRVSLFSDQQI